MKVVDSADVESVREPVPTGAEPKRAGPVVDPGPVPLEVLYLAGAAETGVEASLEA